MQKVAMTLFDAKIVIEYDTSYGDPDYFSLLQDTCSTGQIVVCEEEVEDADLTLCQKRRLSESVGEVYTTFPITVHKIMHQYHFTSPSYITRNESIVFSLSNLIHFALYSIVDTGIIPLHCATLVKNGEAIALCGRSGSGKSTCYSNVSEPWVAHADDMAIVKKCNDGYRIIPFPTWSNFTEDAKDCKKSWDITKSYPLKAVYLLEHGAGTLDKLNSFEAIMTLYSQIVLFFTIFDFEKHNANKHKEKMKHFFLETEKVCKDVPLFKLRPLLGGDYLSLIEESLHDC